MKNIKLDDVLGASSLVFFFGGLALIVSGSILSGLTCFIGAFACTPIIRRKTVEDKMLGGAPLNATGKIAFFIIIFVGVAVSNSLRNAVFPPTPKAQTEKQATATPASIAKPTTKPAVKPSEASNKSAQMIQKQVLEIISAGKKMEPVRHSDHPSVMRTCAEKMRPLLAKAGKLRKESQALSGDYALLKTAVIEADLCVTCSDSAFQSCTMAEQTLSQFKMPVIQLAKKTAAKPKPKASKAPTKQKHATKGKDPNAPIGRRGADLEWYSGGNLHKLTGTEWVKGTSDNRLATASDFAAKYKKPNTMNEMNSMYPPFMPITCSKALGNQLFGI